MPSATATDTKNPPSPIRFLRPLFGGADFRPAPADRLLCPDMRALLAFCLFLLAIGSGQAVAQESVHFASLDSDKTQLDGYLFRPRATTGPFPAVVFLH